MTRAILFLLLAGAACRSAAAPATVASPPASVAGADGAAFRVAVLGDMPYAPRDSPQLAAVLAEYRAVLDTIATEPVAFVVHVGDITGELCSDSLYAQRAREFAAMPHPLVYTPGDNEWTDCGRDTTEVRGGRDPLERLARLRALLAPAGASLGQRPMPVERQGAGAHGGAYPENARWRRGGVLFVALHLVGSNNNWGPDDAPRAEHVARTAANVAWLRDAFAIAERDGLRGVALFMQANPLVAPSRAAGAPPRPNGFTETTDELRRLAAAFGRPVAVVHGDTHTFRIDQPFAHPRTQRPLTNVTRAETWGNPYHHALVMTVDPGSPNLFRFEPLIVRH